MSRLSNDELKQFERALGLLEMDTSLARYHGRLAVAGLYFKLTGRMFVRQNRTSAQRPNDITYPVKAVDWCEDAFVSDLHRAHKCKQCRENAFARQIRTIAQGRTKADRTKSPR